MAKLHNLPLEAPITKVITLLATAMSDAVSPDVATHIDKVRKIKENVFFFFTFDLREMLLVY